MKTSLVRQIAIAVCLLSCISIYSCKKDNSSSGSGSNTATISTEGDDQSQVSSESDAITDDANTAIEGLASFTGETGYSAIVHGTTAVNSVGNASQTSETFNDVHHLICDATITCDTAGGNRTITIVYDGSTNCGFARTRTGTVTIAMPVGEHWKDAGATATITATNLKITRNRDEKSIVIDGSKTITNVSGGLLVDLSNEGTITHSIVSTGITVTFDNGSKRSWQISKQRVFTYDNGIVITTTGTYSDGTDTGIAEWGTNRYGNSFKSIISADKVIRQDCSFRLVSGQNTVKNDNGVTVITYGLDANGDATGCPADSGTYYYKLTWTGNGGLTFTIIAPY
jgi:hypothetical protein